MRSRPLVAATVLVASLMACGGDGEETSATPSKPGARGGASGTAGASGSAGRGGGVTTAGAAGASAGLAGASAAGAGAVSGGSAGAAAGAAGAASAGAAGLGGAAIAGAAGTSNSAGSAGTAGTTSSAGSAGAGGADGCVSQILCGPQAICCPGGTQCTAGACIPLCASGVLCGTTCCAAGDACVAGSCAKPTGDCLDVFDCQPGELCEPALGKCLKEPSVSAKCEVVPEPKPLAPVLKWKWDASDTLPTLNQPMGAPIVIDLDNDGVPDVIGSSRSTTPGGSYNTAGTLRAFIGKSGLEKWPADAAVFAAENRIDTTTAPAAADLDGDKKVAVVARLMTSEIIAFNGDGSVRWRSKKKDGTKLTYSNGGACGYQNNANASLAIADLDGDGHGEIYIGGLIIDSKGVLVAGDNDPSLGSIAFGNNIACKMASSIAADVNGDGKLELIGGNRAVDAQGVEVWKQAALADGWPAVADFDLDGNGELVVVAPSAVRVQNLATGALAKTFATGKVAGAPVIADFDGDGRNEIGVQHGSPCSFDVYEVADDFTVSRKWSRALQACSGWFTATAFDFNGDGRVEVVTHDDNFVWILDGSTGDVSLKLPANHGTWSEFVTVADVDKDGSADLLFPANNDYYGGAKGYFVYQDPDRAWMPTRSIWNQQPYHFTNVRADGSLPKPEAASYGPKGFNNYRVSAQGKAPRLAADFSADLYLSSAKCPTSFEWKATITNKGSIGAPAGAAVTLFTGVAPNGTKIAETTLTKALLPGQSETVTFVVPVTKDASYYVEVNGKTPAGPIIKDCLATNDTAAFANPSCGKD